MASAWKHTHALSQEFVVCKTCISPLVLAAVARIFGGSYERKIFFNSIECSNFCNKILLKRISCLKNAMPKNAVEFLCFTAIRHSSCASKHLKTFSQKHEENLKKIARFLQFSFSFPFFLYILCFFLLLQ